MDEKEILFEDESVIVIHKKPGTAVQTSRTGEMDYVSLLKNHRAARGEDPYIAVIHRLDQPVEGIVLFAKNAKDAAILSGELARGDMEKYYLAVVTDHELPSEGALTDFIRKDEKTNLSKIVSEETKNAKKAQLTFRKLKTDGKHALVEIHLLTGRHHQIRVQMASRGWPVFGDRKYGSVRENAPYHPLALCGYRLSFMHPKDGKVKEFEISPKGGVFQLSGLAVDCESFREYRI